MINWSAWERKWWNRGLSQDTVSSLLESGHSSALEGADMTEETMDRVAARVAIEQIIKEKPSLAIRSISTERAIVKLLEVYEREGL